MGMNKREIIIFILGAVLGILSGFFIGKGIYDRPLVESVTRDTTTTIDTIPDIAPKPKDSATIRYITRYLPIAKRDTSSRVDHFIDVNKMVDNLADTSKMIAVEVPITSKHYQAKEYDAWVSGYEPSLDSIKVYKETQYITERVTLSKPPNKWELDAVAGLDYNITSQHFTPYAGGELLYKPNRLQFGIHGGVAKTDKVTPIIGIKAKLRIL
jgi:hypothetical protein